jgi:hypothetical protein
LLADLVFDCVTRTQHRQHMSCSRNLDQCFLLYAVISLSHGAPPWLSLEPCDRSLSIVGLAFQHEHFITSLRDLINEFVERHAICLFARIDLFVCCLFARADASLRRAVVKLSMWGGGTPKIACC